MPRPYDRTTYDGRVVDWLTRAALELVANYLEYSEGLTLAQGSYNPGVDASAGTHDGGGVVDLAPYDHKRKVRALRRAGFAAWYRPANDLWTAHIHAVLIGNRKLSAAAKVQVLEYLAGYDGLAGNGLDRGPRDYLDNRFKWRTGGRRITRAAGLLARARALLATGIRGYRTQGALRRLRDLEADLKAKVDQ